MSRRTEIPFWDPGELQQALSTQQLGHVLHVFNRITSTNEFAKRIARRGAASGTLVLADMQSAGRGRHGRRWESPAGKGLWFSFVLRCAARTEQIGLLPLLVSAVLAEQFTSFFDRGFQVKWPNDLLADGKKVSGILCEVQLTPPRVDFVIVGIGVNVNQSEGDFPPYLEGRAQSLAMVVQRSVSRRALLLHVLEGLDRAFFSSAGLPIDKLAVWKATCADIGRMITLRRGEAEFAGIFEEVTEQGELILRTGDRLQRLPAAELSLLKKSVAAAPLYE